MANFEKHPKGPLDEIEEADFDAFPAHARSAQLVTGEIKNHRSEFRAGTSGRGQGTDSVILRLDDLPATPRNVERIRERVRRLNDQLSASGAPFRLRMI